jgi:hypothetical protein
MRAIVRILVVIPFAFVVAIVAATALIVFAAGAEPYPGEPTGFFTAKFVIVSLVASTYVGAVAAIPALIAIALAETFRWRSFLLHLVVGAAIGLIAFLMGIGGEPPVAEYDLKIGGAAGAVGGFVYWLIAGRWAGLTAHKPERDPPP